MNFFDRLSDWLSSKGFGFLDVAFKAVIIAAIGMIIIRLVNSFIKRLLLKSKLEKAAHSLIRNLTKTVMYVLLALVVAASIGIDVTGIVALASVLTLAISLALQNMLANVIGGFTLLYTHPFGSGDFVEIAGQSGTIKEIGIAYTKLITPDNKVISIPNSAVVASEIVNYSVNDARRVEITASASYDADSELVVKTLLGTLEGENILSEPAEPFCSVTKYNDSCIDYVLRVWVKSEDYWTVYFSVLKKIRPAFVQNGIEMTYPHLNVHLDK